VDARCIMTFWLDRQPHASETGAHLSSPVNATELAISHLAFAADALAGVALSPTDSARLEALMTKLNGAILR